MKESTFIRHVLIDAGIIVLSMLISMLIYINNVHEYEKKTAKNIIDAAAYNKSFTNITTNCIEAVWITTDFEKWTPFIFSKEKFDSKTILGVYNPNAPDMKYRAITLTYQNAIFIAWARRNSSDVIIRFIVIPLLITLIVLFTLKILFFNLIHYLIQKPHPIKSDTVYPEEKKGYELTEDEIDGLLGRE